MGLCGTTNIKDKKNMDLSKTNEIISTNNTDSKIGAKYDINKGKINKDKINKDKINKDNKIRKSEINLKAKIGERELPIYFNSKSKIEINILHGDASFWSFLPNEELTDFKGHKNYQYNNINIGNLLVRISGSNKYICLNTKKTKFTTSESGSLLLSANLDPNNYSIYQPKGSIILTIVGGNIVSKNKVDELTGYKYIDYDKVEKEKCFTNIYLEIVRYINKARSNIKKYIKDFILNFNDKDFNLDEYNNLPLLQIDNELYEIAEQHCLYLCKNGTSGHIGTNDKIIINKENYADCIIYGFKNPILITNLLIIDKYSKNKENRKNLLNKYFSKIGICLSEHISYRFCCVIIFGK